MNWKPAAAFAAGLWIGAVVAVAIGAFYLRVWGGSRREGDPRTAVAQTVEEKGIEYLKQEQARLSAEAQRLRETVAELKSNLEAGSGSEPRGAVRRIPFRRPSSPGDSGDDWIAEAVAGGNVQSLPRLEGAANQNNEAALEALALMADRDAGAALTRVWSSETLTLPNRVKATRYLAATLEANPRAADLLQSLFDSSTTDVRMLYAAVDGIANPGVAADINAIPSQSLPSRSQPDFDTRVKLLDTLAAVITDQSLRDHVEHARDDLLTRWAQAEPVAQ